MHGFEFVQGNNSDLFIVKDVEEKKNLVFKWFDKEEIIEDNIRPAFLNEKLISMIEEKKTNKKKSQIGVEYNEKKRY